MWNLRARLWHLLGIAALSSVLLMASVATSSAANHTRAVNHKKITIGVVLPPLNIPAIKLLHDGLVAAAKKHGFNLLVCDSVSAVQQASCGETYIARHVDMIGVNADDGAAFRSVVDHANAKGIPVAAMIAPPKGTIVYHVGANYLKVGQLQGQGMVNLCKNKNPCKVAVIQGDAADLASNALHDGIVSAFQGHPNIKLVADQQSKWQDSEVLRITNETLLKNPDLAALDVIYEAGAVIAVQGIQSSGKSGRVGVFTAQAYYCPAWKDLLGGSIAFDVFTPWYDTGQAFINTAAQVLNGKKVPKEIVLVGTPISTAQAKAIAAGKGTAPAYVQGMLKTAAKGC